MHYITLTCVICCIVGSQIFLKKSSQKIFSADLDSLVSFTSLKFYLSIYELWIAGVLTLLSGTLWLITLKGLPLQTAYSALAITFVFVPAASVMILGEEFRPSILWGGVIIGIGIVVIHGFSPK